ncbi:MAG TPA: phosphate ABC transporter substrate-binding protein [Holophagaceae bacterium]|nr:phosphate ABC transporter substrate-binding protein [Holophagaceae bacterium]
MRTLLFLLIHAAAALLSGEEAPPPYRATHALAGELVLVGSDSMDPLLRLWIDEFRKHHPEARVEAVSKGSLTAPPALAERRTVLGPMSRPMKEGELELTEKGLGFRPRQLIVAYDALAIWVNRANPLRRLTMEQLDAIFSKSRNQGWEEPIRTWGDLGLRGEWKRRDIVPYGRDGLSGTRSFFDEQALGKGQVNPRFQVAGDQWAVVEAPGKDPRGISYGPVNYAEPAVRQLPLVPVYGREGILPTTGTIASGRYPLTRTLSIYVAADAGHPLPELAREFLRFILSREGQALVAGYGSVPIPAELAATQAAWLEGR